MCFYPRQNFHCMLRCSACGAAEEEGNLWICRGWILIFVRSNGGATTAVLLNNPDELTKA